MFCIKGKTNNLVRVTQTHSLISSVKPTPLTLILKMNIKVKSVNTQLHLTKRPYSTKQCAAKSDFAIYLSKTSQSPAHSQKILKVPILSLRAEWSTMATEFNYI